MAVYRLKQSICHSRSVTIAWTRKSQHLVVLTRNVFCTVIEVEFLFENKASTFRKESRSFSDVCMTDTHLFFCLEALIGLRYELQFYDVAINVKTYQLVMTPLSNFARPCQNNVTKRTLQTLQNGISHQVMTLVNVVARFGISYLSRQKSSPVFIAVTHHQTDSTGLGLHLAKKHDHCDQKQTYFAAHFVKNPVSDFEVRILYVILRLSVGAQHQV